MLQTGQEFTPPPWLALGFEGPIPAKGCDQGCQPSDIGAVDVYCERHGRFLPGTPGGLAWIGGPDQIRRTSRATRHNTVPTMSGSVAAFAAVAAILASAALATPRWAPTFQLEPWLLGLAATCVVAAAFTTVVSAMVESGSHIERTVTNLVRPPEKSTPLDELMRAHHSRVGPARDIFDHIRNAFAIFFVRASYVTRLMLFAALMALCATVNLLHAWLVRLGRRMVAMLRLSLSLVGHAFLIGVKSMLHSLKCYWCHWP